MTRLRFSISLAAGRGTRSATELARYGALAEELGFHAIYATDHFFFRGPVMHSVSAVAALAAVTSRLRLGFCSYVLPLRHPIAAARELATLDALSEGRLVAGLAAGSSAPEFAAFGIPFEERGRRLDEGIEAMRAVWTSPEAEFHGRFYDFAGVRLEPKPLQQPYPPIWLGSWSGVPRTARRIARHAAGWQASGLHTSLEQVRQGRDAIARACAELGRDPATVACSYVNAITAVSPSGTSPSGQWRRRSGWKTPCG